jgi:hypothetical protein
MLHGRRAQRNYFGIAIARVTPRYRQRRLFRGSSFQSGEIFNRRATSSAHYRRDAARSRFCRQRSRGKTRTWTRARELEMKSDNLAETSSDIHIVRRLPLANGRARDLVHGKREYFSRDTGRREGRRRAQSRGSGRLSARESTLRSTLRAESERGETGFSRCGADDPLGLLVRCFESSDCPVSFC